MRKAAALAALVSGLACSSKPGAMPVQDPERQSNAEYDLAKDLWLRQNQPRDALAHALKAADLNEDNSEAAHLVGLIYLDFCRWSPDECHLAEAEKYVKRAVAAQPAFREAKNTLGVVLIHEKKYDEAVGVLRPLTEDILYQTPENAWGNLGWAYLEKGDADRAIDALRRSLAAQPSFCVGGYRLGLAYEKKGDSKAAIEALSRALETNDPGCKAMQDAYAARARSYMHLGKTDEAKADLERCVQLDKAARAGRECASLQGKLK